MQISVIKKLKKKNKVYSSIYESIQKVVLCRRDKACIEIYRIVQEPDSSVKFRQDGITELHAD